MNTAVDAPRFPFEKERELDPPSLYAKARAEQPVFPVSLWNGDRAWLVTRYDDMRAICNDPRFTSEMSRPGFPSVTAARRAIDAGEKSFIGMDNPRHEHFRRMFTKEFSVKRMLALRPRIEEIAEGLIAAMIAEGAPANVVSQLALKFPALVICEVFGSPYEDHVFINRCAAGRHGLDQSAAEASDSAKELVDYMSRLIDAKEREPGDDLISRTIANFIQPGLLSREDFSHIGSLLLRAGHDTTANMISLGTLLLLQHPDQFEMLKADVSLIDSAVEEMLRYLSPVQFVPRRMALEDVEVNGSHIRAGEGVFALNAAANRDERVFTDPDRFDITRDASAHVTFGYGLHQCLGQILARVELQAMFKAIVTRLPNLRLATPGKVVFKENVQIFGLYELPVSW